MKGGVPLYFTVTVSNSAGGKSTATCSIPTYDVTLPVGRIEPAFRTTSNPRILEATSVLYDDSEIISEQVAIGFGPGIWGDQIVPWTDTQKTRRTHNAGRGKNELTIVPFTHDMILSVFLLGQEKIV